MHEYLVAFIVVFGYGAVGFILLLLCAGFVDRLYPEENEINIERSNHHV